MLPHECLYLRFTSYNCIETITYYTYTRVLTKIPDISWPCDWCPSTCRILRNHTNKTCCWQIQVLYCLMYYFVFRKIDFRPLIVFKLPTNLPTHVTLLDLIGHYFCFYPSRTSYYVDDAHAMRRVLLRESLRRRPTTADDVTAGIPTTYMPSPEIHEKNLIKIIDLIL